MFEEKLLPDVVTEPTNCASSAGLPGSVPIRMMSKSPEASMSATTGIGLPGLLESVSLPVQTPASDDVVFDPVEVQAVDALLLEELLLEDDELLEDDPLEPPPHAASIRAKTAGIAMRALARISLPLSILTPCRVFE